MDENEETKKTHFANACQEPSSKFLYPWLLSPLSQTQTKTSGHPTTTTTTIGVFMPSPVVHPACRTTQDLAGSVRVWE